MTEDDQRGSGGTRAGLSTDHWRMCWTVYGQYHEYGIGGSGPAPLGSSMISNVDELDSRWLRGGE